MKSEGITWVILILSYINFWATDRNQKWTHRIPGEDSDLFQIFKLIIVSTREKILNNMNMVVWRQMK